MVSPAMEDATQSATAGARVKLLYDAVSAMMSALPLSVALAIGRRLGWFYGNILRYHRPQALEALARAFPEITLAERRTILARMYGYLGMNVAELLRMKRASDEYYKTYVEWGELSHLHDTLKKGKGLLVLSAHTGNWDLLCSLAPHIGFPLTIITKDIKARSVNEYWMDIRRRFGLQFVPAHNSYRLCLTDLKRNEVVGFVLDQNMIDVEGIFVDFFNKPACTSPGLAYMSAQSGAPVVPVFAERLQGGRHRMHILPPIDPPPNREPETIRQYTQLYTKVIEDFVREHPEQWIWIHRRWRTVLPPQTPTPDAG